MGGVALQSQFNFNHCRHSTRFHFFYFYSQNMEKKRTRHEWESRQDGFEYAGVFFRHPPKLVRQTAIGQATNTCQEQTGIRFFPAKDVASRDKTVISHLQSEEFEKFVDTLVEKTKVWLDNEGRFARHWPAVLRSDFLRTEIKDAEIMSHGNVPRHRSRSCQHNMWDRRILCKNMCGRFLAFYLTVTQVNCEANAVLTRVF